VPAPSPGVGGYCLEKDPFIFISSAKAYGETLNIVRNGRETNERMISAVAHDIDAHLAKNFSRTKASKIFLMGIAFKGRPATSDLRGSPTLALVDLLKRRGYKNIVGYDPVVPHSEIRARGIRPMKTIKDGTRGAHAVIIMNNHEAFSGLNLGGILKHAAARALFFDTWALYESTDVSAAPHVVHRRL
jgi:UDP-N-acetyl-D-mannosaminuronic acid dehydrogenase